MSEKTVDHPLDELYLLVNKINDYENREKALLAHNHELKEHITYLKENRDSLKDENIKLKKLLNDVLLGYDRSNSYFECLYPPYHVAAELGLTSRGVGKIVKDLKLEEYPGVCRRIKRIRKKDPAKYETTLVFSEFGIHVLDEILSYCLDHPNASPLFYDYATKGKTNNPEYLKWRDKLIDHYSDVWETLAK